MGIMAWTEESNADVQRCNMAPEMIRHELYTSKADVYSWGVLLAECLAQRPPYEGMYLTPVQVTIIPPLRAVRMEDVGHCREQIGPCNCLLGVQGSAFAIFIDPSGIRFILSSDHIVPYILQYSLLMDKCRWLLQWETISCGPHCHQTLLKRLPLLRWRAMTQSPRTDPPLPL
jgi:hypothetical protein